MRAAIEMSLFTAGFQATLLQAGQLLQPTFDTAFVGGALQSFEREFRDNTRIAEQLSSQELLTRTRDTYFHRFSLFDYQLKILNAVNTQLQAKGLSLPPFDIGSLEGVFHLAADAAIGETDHPGFGSKVATVFVDSLEAFCRQLDAPPLHLQGFMQSYRGFLVRHDFVKALTSALDDDGHTASFIPDASVLDAGLEDTEPPEEADDAGE